MDIKEKAPAAVLRSPIREEKKPSVLKRLVGSDGFVLLVWILGFAAVWELGAFYIAFVSPKHPEYILPHLWQIMASVGMTASADQTIFGLVMTNAWATLSRAGIGFLIGMALGALLALSMSLSGAVEKIAFPYLMIIQMIPILGMAPIVLSLTGDISSSRIVIAAILTFYPVAANMLAGFKSVSREKHELMFSYAVNRFTLYKKVMIPTCLPYFFTGLKIAAPMAITASILVDTLQGGVGLGCLLSQSLKHNTSIFAFWEIVFLSAALGIFFSKLMGFFESLLSGRYHSRRKKGEAK